MPTIRHGEQTMNLSSKRPRLALLAVILPAVTAGAFAIDIPDRKPTDDDGKIDTLEALVWGVPATPIVRQGGSAAATTVSGASATGEAPLKYPWIKSLDDALNKAVAGEIPAVEDPLVPILHFFPAAGENTYFWLNVPLPGPLRDGEKVVARLRPKDGSVDASFSLGTEVIPFEVRPTAGGAIAQAARDLPPGAYTMAIGTVAPDGAVTLRSIGEQRIVRMPQEALKLSSVIFAESIEQKTGAQQGPFQASGFVVVPRTSNTIKPGDTLRVFFVVLGASVGADNNPNLDVSYQLYARPGGGDWKKAPTPYLLKARTGSAQAWELPLPEKFPQAEWKLEIVVKDNVSGGQVTAPDLVFKVAR